MNNSEAKRGDKKAVKVSKKPKGQGPRQKNWAFTDFEMLDFEKIYNDYSAKIAYLCVGIEVCPESKKTHNQGWIQFKSQQRLTAIKKMVSNITHFEPCKGSAASNDRYCKKDGKWKAFGTCTTQGQRTDLDALQAKIKGGATRMQIIEEDFSLYCRYRGGIDVAIQEYCKANNRQFRHLKVLCYYGDTNTGKTRDAMADEANGLPFKIAGNSLNWWDGYDGEKTIVIDDYNNDVTITRMLNILDGYTLRLPIKGGFTYASWTKVYLTTNLQKEEIHVNAKPAHRAALFRRIKVFKHFRSLKKKDDSEEANMPPRENENFSRDDYFSEEEKENEI